VYLLKGNQWQVKAAMPAKCMNGSCTKLKEHIYVLGGSEPRMMRCHTETDKWTVLSSPQFAHTRGTATEWKGKILLLGGTDTDRIEEFDPATDQWSLWDTRMPRKDWYRSAFAMMRR
jgi:hypothetical protein